MLMLLYSLLLVIVCFVCFICWVCPSLWYDLHFRFCPLVVNLFVLCLLVMTFIQGFIYWHMLLLDIMGPLVEEVHLNFDFKLSNLNMMMVGDSPTSPAHIPPASSAEPVVGLNTPSQSATFSAGQPAITVSTPPISSAALVPTTPSLLPHPPTLPPTSEGEITSLRSVDQIDCCACCLLCCPCCK